MVRRVPELGEIGLREPSAHEEVHGLGAGDATVAVGVRVREPVVVFVRLLHFWIGRGFARRTRRARGLASRARDAARALSDNPTTDAPCAACEARARVLTCCLEESQMRFFSRRSPR